MVLRQNYLTGIPCHYEKIAPGHKPFVYENLALGEVIAHWGAMTELAHFVEKGHLPPEAVNIGQHILDSAKDIQGLIAELPLKEQALVQRALGTIEGGFGDQKIQKPILMDRERLQAIQLKLTPATPTHATHTIDL
jgi:hypothetical protein